MITNDQLTCSRTALSRTEESDWIPRTIHHHFQLATKFKRSAWDSTYTIRYIGYIINHEENWLNHVCRCAYGEFRLIVRANRQKYILWVSNARARKAGAASHDGATNHDGSFHDRGETSRRSNTGYTHTDARLKMLGYDWWLVSQAVLSHHDVSSSKSQISSFLSRVHASFNI